MFRNKKGVSPVIAVVLMIVVAVAISLVVYVWASGFVSEKTQAETKAGDFSFILETRAVDNTNIRNTGTAIDFVFDTDSHKTFLETFDLYADDVLKHDTDAYITAVSIGGTEIAADATWSNGSVLTIDFDVAKAPGGTKIKLVHKDSGTPIVFKLE